MSKLQKIAIVTTCPEDWGGSEELWFRAIPYLKEAGLSITVCKSTINYKHSAFVKMTEWGVDFFEWKDAKLPKKSKKIGLKSFLKQFKPKKDEKPSPFPEEHYALVNYLKETQIDLVVVAQGMNFDGNWVGYFCMLNQLRYAFIAQKAVEVHWPSPRDGMRNVLLKAEKQYFISKHNLTLTEEQFGVKFSNAEVIYNPVKMERRAIPYPSTENGYKLACIGRYFLLDKGQDMLIRIMASEKWKNRPISISFIGSGVDKEALVELANFLGADNIEFLGHTSNIEELWAKYHALILPSRYEGMPLVLMESMAVGRTAIVTVAGGNAEIVENNHTGFLSEINERDIENVLENAWQVRQNWEQMGLNALEKLKNTVPEVPEKIFADSLMNVNEYNPDLVSVIIPTYNRATLVEQAVQSVLNQTYPNIQLIVADDGSTDNTAEVMAKYPQVTYLQVEHGGQSHARNQGLNIAKGAFIASLDSDDTWHPEFIQSSLKLINEYNADFVFSNWMQQWKDGQFVDRFTICNSLKDRYKSDDSPVIPLNNFELRDMYLIACPSPTSSLFFRRSSLRSKWTLGLRIADDWCLLMDMIYTSNCSAVVNKKVLWNKRVDGQNICDGISHEELVKNLMLHDLEFTSKRFENFFTSSEKKRLREHLSAQYMYHFFYEMRANKNITSNLKYLLSAFAKNKKVGLWVLRKIKNKLKNKVKKTLVKQKLA